MEDPGQELIREEGPVRAVPEVGRLIEDKCYCRDRACLVTSGLENSDTIGDFHLTYGWKPSVLTFTGAYGIPQYIPEKKYVFDNDFHSYMDKIDPIQKYWREYGDSSTGQARSAQVPTEGAAGGEGEPQVP